MPVPSAAPVRVPAAAPSIEIEALAKATVALNKRRKQRQPDRQGLEHGRFHGNCWRNAWPFSVKLGLPLSKFSISSGAEVRR